MGNTQQSVQHQGPEEIPTKREKGGPRKYILEVCERDIIINYKKKIKLNIADIVSFPAQFEGLHLWDTNIILARYIYLNQAIFEGKKVIELLSGTGIGSITLKKYTKASLIAATDRQPEVINNLSKNCLRNEVTCGMTLAPIRWSQYKNYQSKFDIVIGADLLFKNCPIKTLIKAANKLLQVSGIMIIIQPTRPDESEKFWKLIKESECFQIEKFSILDEEYLQSPLLNQVQGFEKFPLIQQGKFYGYKLTKLKQIENLFEEQSKNMEKAFQKAEQEQKNPLKDQIKKKAKQQASEQIKEARAQPKEEKTEDEEKITVQAKEEAKRQVKEQQKEEEKQQINSERKENNQEKEEQLEADEIKKNEQKGEKEQNENQKEGEQKQSNQEKEE